MTKGGDAFSPPNLLELARYIVLNPVRAKMVRTPRAWPWSSYRETIGAAPKRRWLHTEWILASFAKTKKVAIRRYIEFVKQGKGQPSPWEKLKNQVFLGEDKFVNTLQSSLKGDKALSEVPRSQRRKKPLSLERYEKRAKTRNEAIVNSYASGGYTQKEIGDYYGLHYAHVSRIITQAKRRI